MLMLFDLDGFKDYNDTFGHLAGDALLSRLGGKLAAAVADHGAAYRLGGDEFCALLAIAPDELGDVVTAAADALAERGSNFDVAASYGAVLLPARGDEPRLRPPAGGRAHVRAQAEPQRRQPRPDP